MASYVEIDDVGAARTAAGALTRAGGQLGSRGGNPPTPNFGDDSFGDAMRQSYPEDLPGKIEENRRHLSRMLSQMGSNVTAAVAGYTGADREGADRFGRI